jgi:iron(III) transport system substrate-binding protein
MRLLLVLLLIAAALAGAAWWLWPPASAEGRVVLYCSQDRDFAEGALDTFKARTGLDVAVTYDTEANKSVTHVVRLIAEKDRPRCDLFWNNEVLGTIRLQKLGLLEPYDSPSARDLQPFPKSAQTADHAWHGFAARARVLIVNTEVVPEDERPRSLLDLADERFAGRAVMAKPNHGTSATQAACLFEVLGPDQAKAFYRRLKANKVQIAPGNKQVAEWVGAGKAAVGVTDTDDALEELHAGRPVRIVFPDRDGGPGRMGTLFIPNTLAIVKGCPDPEGARRLVDYLLSAEVEGRLAESGGRQVPFRPELRAKLPPEVPAPPQVRPMEVDFFKAAGLWDEVQTFLRQEFGVD